MSFDDIYYRVIISFVEPFFTAIFKVKFNFPAMSLKGFLLWDERAPVSVAKIIVKTVEGRELRRKSALKSSHLPSNENLAPYKFGNKHSFLSAVVL